MKKLFIALTVLFTYSCKETPEITYFGGEIVNPYDDTIYLLYEDDIIDSVELDDNNRFMFELSDIKEGLYRFENNEYQHIILEKGDSLLMRLNTIDNSFDESLVFSGRGAEKNNFLIDLFLLIEDEEYWLIPNFYDIDPVLFEKKLDSLREMKMELYADFVKENDNSDLVNHIAKASIDYPYYRIKEQFPLRHKYSNNLDSVPQMPEGYYGYLKDISYSDSVLVYYRPYLQFMDKHLNRLAFMYSQKHRKDKGTVWPLQFFVHKLDLIDSLLSKDAIKEDLFESTALSYFKVDHNNLNNKAFIDHYHTVSQHEEKQHIIDNIYHSIVNLQPGKTVPTLTFVDMEGDLREIDSLHYPERTVYYFWSMSQKNHTKNIRKQIFALQEKFPNCRFIGINIDSDQKMWKDGLIAANMIEDTNQFRARSFDYLINTLGYIQPNRVIVVGKNGKVIEGFGNIFNVAPILQRNDSRLSQRVYR
ncbi:TlpA family protein disulfide reductase [Robertkochia solimangrovi]|uniref:TlpA family protein disulfide reductase n=1 Tax=Robertkochia solimangrovi TaxID=2213046 RepID=UPI00117DD54E|nr:hypothetical protein [Robertkochia solimangrovi]TRZ45191.1 hypothetical protein DMZ48_05435 [Robertkochia solimangrovi]